MKRNKHGDLRIIGNRIRYLRTLIGIDRREMEARYQIKVTSLDKWENGKTNILPKNIARLISIALDHSIECTSEWLISGEGPPPKTITSSILTSQQSGIGNTPTDMMRDLNYLKNTYPNLITMTIIDEAMAPFYLPGDYVAGNVINLEKLKEYLNIACIVHTADGKERLRNIGYSNGSWFLYGNYLKHKGTPFLEANIELTKVAPVFWHRIKL
jgi:transcriptional regulator with XRE-family HTH domain